MHLKQSKRADDSNVKVLARAASILRALDSDREGKTVSEIAAVTSIPRPTVQRIAHSLMREGLLCNTGRGKRIVLGPDLHRLALSVHLDLSTVVQPVMEALSQEVEETVNLLAQNGKHAVCVTQSCFLQELQVAPKIGNELLLHASAAGKAMLSCMQEEDAKALLGAGRWKHLTPHTLTRWPDLVLELDHIRITGIASDVDEHTLGVAAVAVPISTLCGRLHALAVPAPTQRLQLKRLAIERALRRAKRKVDQLIQEHRI